MKLITEQSFQTGYTTQLDESTGKKSYFLEGVFMQAEIKNRNGRIYKESVLRPAVQRYVETQVKTNRAVGELNHPCFKANAEVLIQGQGWKKINEIKKGDLVYTLNTDKNEIEIKPVLNEIKNYYGNNKMYRFVGRGIDTTVTPDHKFLLVNRNGSYEKFTAKEIFDGWNNRSLAHHYLPKTTLNWDIDYDENKMITIEADEEAKLKLHQENLYIPENIFAQFMGLYMSEGCVSIDSKGTYRINIFQRKEKNKDIIDSVLNSLPVNFSSYETKEKTKVWTSHDRRLGIYLKQFGNCYEKFLDKKIKSLSPKSSLEFIKYFNLGDGRLRQNGKMKDIFSTSKQLIEDISELLIKCGMAFHIKTENCLNDYEFAGKVIKAENKSTLYLLEILSTKGVYIDNRFLDIQETTNGEEDEYVYCIETENGNFMARENGQNFWTGNCGPTVNYKEVSHKIESLEWKGNDVIGKAKILDTPNGVLVKALLDGGCQIGVSSRGMGSVTIKDGIDYIGEDFILNTIDIVQDPSAPAAFVNGIMEGIEWKRQGDIYVAVTKKRRKEIAEVKSKTMESIMESKKAIAFRNFINKL